MKCQFTFLHELVLLRNYKSYLSKLNLLSTSRLVGIDTERLSIEREQHDERLSIERERHDERLSIERERLSIEKERLDEAKKTNEILERLVSQLQNTR
ncbi:unnamed protein product [Mytilus edulis]|uniref:Uncharacterized protein n=1 Tax=Mytilus edulis TaxID=6550 RepID=A0A8S3RB40_MYTED|nr:unnamed protein product [Mytilus edulis]